MIHHQHYFPVVDEDGKLKPAFLAVINMQAEKPEIIARNSERVLTARLRDARFFWDADRKTTLESRIDRLSTILFHKKLGSYREKADRVAALARWIAGDAFEQPGCGGARPSAPGGSARPIWPPTWCASSPSCRGRWAASTPARKGSPRRSGRRSTTTTCPIGVEADAPPSRQQLGAAAVTWAAVSLADKLDSVVGMFAAGERPTGSRDPLGLRRQAQGAVKILADLPELTGLDTRLPLGRLLEQAGRAVRRRRRARGAALLSFMRDRVVVPARAARLRRAQRARRDCTAASTRSARSRRAASSRRWRR